MKVAESELVAVTGIRAVVPGKSAEVEFTWRFSNITPFGEAAKLLYSDAKRRDYNEGMLYSAKVQLDKYDDGWRVSGAAQETGAIPDPAPNRQQREASRNAEATALAEYQRQRDSAKAMEAQQQDPAQEGAIVEAGAPPPV